MSRRMGSTLAAAAMMLALGGIGGAVAEMPVMRAQRPNDPIRHRGRRKPKGKGLNRRAFPGKARATDYMPAPPKGFIYVRDYSQSGLVPKLVRRGAA